MNFTAEEKKLVRCCLVDSMHRVFPLKKSDCVIARRDHKKVQLDIAEILVKHFDYEYLE